MALTIMIGTQRAMAEKLLLITQKQTKVYIGKKPQKEPRKKPLKL